MKLITEDQVKNYMIARGMKLSLADFKDETNILWICAFQAQNDNDFHPVLEYALNYEPALITTKVITSASFLKYVPINTFKKVVMQYRNLFNHHCGELCLESGDIDKFKCLLDAGIIDLADKDGGYFITALKYCSFDSIKYFVDDLKVDINSRDSFASMMCAKFQPLETFKYLVDHGLKIKDCHKTMVRKLLLSDCIKARDKEWVCQHI